MGDLPNGRTKAEEQELRDEQDLAAMGHSQDMSRKFGVFSMLSLAFCVLGTWSTFAQDLSSGLSNGGPISILWGLVLVTICNLCIAVSLGELVSSMPTALGQAYWVHKLLEGPGGEATALGKVASYYCAWINTFGWWTLGASQIAFMTDFLLGMKVIFDNDWEGASTGWIQFLVYLAVTVFLTVLNLVFCRREKVLPYFNNFVGVCFVGLFFVFMLALLITVGVRRNLAFQSGTFVFGTWINQTGWSNGVTWFIGLVQAAYGLTAFDSAIHMVEEIPNPRRNMPRIVFLAVAMGALSGFVFMVVCLFCIQSLDDVLNGPTGLPFMDLCTSTIGLQGSAVLLALFIFNGLGQGVSILTTGSRMTWGFARDGGLPWSNTLAAVNPTWKVPANALYLQGALVGLVGVLYTFSDTVLSAILSVSTIALTISYAMPILALLWAGRGKLPPHGQFHLGRLGPVCNWVSIVYCAITTVFFLFPGSPNPGASDMNYAIAVFGVMMVIATAFWFIRGRRDYLETRESVARVIYAQNEMAAQTVSPDRKDL
ncbi:amino acid permease family protein [Sporothrix brasiliensis 5110]|uniref:Amino acid permease family protein n=1 Tax=Sporothrix brasiliensis 5110 TaxID=1398154 RepID=A0A0C2IXG4_9PEZI|nr:amino acid permease family protein [Sporothrix brasiliensis 5110]KIH89697.1 amino acid permease family protein [Sporothrix brasiliensis 5110]